MSYFLQKVNQFKNFFRIKKFFEFINKNYKKKIFNSLISSILRISFRNKVIFRYYFFLKKATDIRALKEFWILQIGFTKQKMYFPFVKIDPYLSNNPLCCCNIKNLPFEPESCQIIQIKHFFRYFKSKDLNNVLKAWKKKLIPGGILEIKIFPKKNNEEIKLTEKILKKHNFYIKKIDNFDLLIDGSVTITAIKEKIIGYPLKYIQYGKIDDIMLILNQNKEIFTDKHKICILGCHSEYIKNYLISLSLNGKEIHTYESLNQLAKVSQNYFDFAIIANHFEFINYSQNIETFNQLSRILKSSCYFLVIIPEKREYLDRDSTQLFDKGIFLKTVDENNVRLEWINLSSSFKLIQILLRNEKRLPINKNNIKIFLLGVYSLRYTFLNNARWDSQARAFERLGYITYIFDIEDYSFYYIFKLIKFHKPDILWIGGKIGYDFLKKYANFFRESKMKIIYWLWDIITPEKFDFKHIIDCLFITSKEEIPLYKAAYNLERVYYMPAAIMPEIIHRNKYIKEKYEVGFSGQLDYTKLYKERYEYFKFIQKRYNTVIFRNIFNNLPECYSQCKIIFGGTPSLAHLELYASNREYIALGCGCCFITNYFKGLEKLAENKKHLLWFNNREELLNLLNKYINNDDLREEIKKNAAELALEKHNYLIRIQNMLDIINGKTEEFYGFIK